MKWDIQIKVPIFGSVCDFYFGDVQRLTDYMNAITKAGYNGKETMHYEDTKGLTWGSYVYMKNIKSHSNIAHEINHLVTNILEKKGIFNDETRAYITGYITGKFYKKIEKLNANL